ncbi:MAG TPA: hypothetical protein VMO47_15705 [Rhodothermales bacterium]|nr:hypothetical protein [Rhodothermales bacterium]
MRLVLAVTAVLILSCSSDRATDRSGAAACSADEVLHEIARIVEARDLELLSAITLRLKDLYADDAGDPPQRDNFDAAILKQNISALASLLNAHQRLQLKSVRTGKIESHVHVEGTEVFVDRMPHSEIVFDKAGTEIRVRVSLIKAHECWKLEYLGPGTLSMTMTPGDEKASQGRRIRDREGTGFRHFLSDDFCTGLTIYRSPWEGDKIGTLVEGYKRYRDPRSGDVIEAVLLQSLAAGHVQGIWMSRNQLTSTYVNRADIALQDCSWSVREDEVSPLPEETPIQ